jgi:hypothetical protein
MIPDCFVCGKTFQPAFGDHQGDSIQPFGGVVFGAHGGYGGIFDPPTGYPALVLVICDDCLVERKDRARELFTSSPVVEYRYEPWDPEAQP